MNLDPVVVNESLHIPPAPAAGLRRTSTFGLRLVCHAYMQKDAYVFRNSTS
jgi:hypothetical protein